MPLEPNQPDRVRANTSPKVLEDLDEAAAERVTEIAVAGQPALDERIGQLESESDIERLLEINASALAFIGVALGATVNRRWLVLPAVVTAFLFQHGVQGWCPPVPLFRRLGVRTRQEIEAERYALKAIRGDFDRPTSPDGAEPAMEAVSR
jgi:hypothetical protein